jgi:hypothetical protein
VIQTVLAAQLVTRGGLLDSNAPAPPAAREEASPPAKPR